MRCGWTTPKNVGSAVIRNRLKRWCRVYFRSLTGSGRELPVDVNVVFRPMKDDFYRKLSYEAFAKILDKGWTQLERRLR